MPYDYVYICAFIYIYIYIIYIISMFYVLSCEFVFRAVKLARPFCFFYINGLCSNLYQNMENVGLGMFGHEVNE